MSAVVLLSSGLDSTANLYEAVSEFKNVTAVHFQYGQRAGRRELEKAQQLTKKFGIELIVLELPWFKTLLNTSALLNDAIEVPGKNEVQIDSLETSHETAQKVWVPNRNGIFLNIAAGVAEALKCSYIIPGFNAEEAATFPDNSNAFLKVLDHSFSYSTANKVKTKCYTTHLQKTEILKKALLAGLRIEELWPCYHAAEKWCGECESCQRFQRAMHENHLSGEGLFL